MQMLLYLFVFFDCCSLCALFVVGAELWNIKTKSKIVRGESKYSLSSSVSISWPCALCVMYKFAVKRRSVIYIQILHFTTQHLHLVAISVSRHVHSWLPVSQLWSLLQVTEDLLTCFTIVGVEVLWEGQTPNLFLENFNIFGIYLSRPC